MTEKTPEQRIVELEETVAGLTSLLQKILNPEGKIDLNMTIEEMIVHVTNKSHVTYEVTTNNVEGKMMFCAVDKDAFDRKSFTYSEMQACLGEHGWPVPDKTLTNNLASLVSKGLLIKLDNRAGYRLPTKVAFIGGNQ